MPSVRAPSNVAVTMHAANTLGPANGTAITVTGASRAFIAISNEGTLGTAGIYTFEKSTDGGSEWTAAGNVKLLSSGAVAATAPAGGAGVEPTTLTADLYTIDPQDGPMQIRARISTAWVTGAPAVFGWVVG